MWLHNASENGWGYITGAVAVGAGLFLALQPLIPEVSLGGGGGYAEVGAAEPGPGGEARGRGKGGDGRAGAGGGGAPVPRGELMRLGVLMAVTMTAHNLPEGVAVGASALTPVGPLMALAIAVHNIPEGVIIAAPIYAATGSRARAVGIATLSGLSEPFGALLALTLLHGVIGPEWLEGMLACVGGVMLAVCVKELWPEGRKCGHDAALVQGVAAGSVAMLWTLYMGI